MRDFAIQTGRRSDRTADVGALSNSLPEPFPTGVLQQGLAQDADTICCRAAASDADLLGQMAVRWDVFVLEQDVALVLEIDARDFLPTTTQIVAVAPGERVVGAARLLRDAGNRSGWHFHVGRVAVRREWRGHRIGESLMRCAAALAQAQVPAGEPLTLTLDAQVQAEPFYARLGYVPTPRPRFLDAGILHQEMRKTTVGTGA